MEPYTKPYSDTVRIPCVTSQNQCLNLRCPDSRCTVRSGSNCTDLQRFKIGSLVAHDCGYPLSRYTCRATRVAADFLDFIAFCRCSTGVALHPLRILVSHLPPVCREVSHRNWLSEKVGRCTGVSQPQSRVSRYTVQLRLGEAKPGCFQTRVFPTFFGKGPDCVADPFGTVPRRCG